jgi:2-polyprenyl-6-methoxyphenol hydroxylase-like FAD-dependent oxidoreductase
MLPNYDVIVVGAGPIGITTACTLKAVQNRLNICVIDKRPEPVRTHGLRINGDSVDKIQELLKSTVNSDSFFTNHEKLHELGKIFESWRDNFIRTSQIENDLASVASYLGITVLRHADCAVTEENLAYLCSAEGEAPNDAAIKLQHIFENASVIIGADGAHSVIRKVVMNDEFSQRETTLSLAVYQSAQCVELYHDKYVLLVGDAESGLVLERGFNKGLKGAALCARAVSSFFTSHSSADDALPPSFQSYEEEMKALFENERKWAKIKNTALKLAEAPLWGSMMAKETSTQTFATSSRLAEIAYADADWDASSSSCTLL